MNLFKNFVQVREHISSIGIYRGVEILRVNHEELTKEDDFKSKG